VGTAVVHSVHLSGVLEHGDGMPAGVGHVATTLFQVLQRPDSYQTLYCGRHVDLSSTL